MQAVSPIDSRLGRGSFEFVGGELFIQKDKLPEHVPTVELSEHGFVEVGQGEKIILAEGNSEEVCVLAAEQIGMVVGRAYGHITAAGSLVMPGKSPLTAETRHLVDLLIANRLTECSEDAVVLVRQLGSGVSLHALYAASPITQAYIEDFGQSFGVNYAPQQRPRLLGGWAMSH